MGFDGVLMAAVRAELEPLLVGSRVTKIYQPGRNDLLLHLRRPTGEWKLFCSCDPRFARIYLTDHEPVNPLTPPPFCMLLRKYLEGARLAFIEQPGYERVIRIGFEAGYAAAFEGGASGRGVGSAPGAPFGRDAARFSLVVEIMGKHSNILFLDEQSGSILDAIRRVGPDKSRYRDVSPGQPYLPPPPQEKRSPLEWNEESFVALFRHAPPQATLSRVLVDGIMGVGPGTAQAILCGADREAEPGAEPGVAIGPDTPRGVIADAEVFLRIWDAFSGLQEALRSGRFRPGVGADGEDIVAYDPSAPVRDPGSLELNRMIDRVYGSAVEERRMTELRQELERAVGTALARAGKKLAVQQEEHEAAKAAEEYRLFGELLTAQLHLVHRGEKVARVQNYYAADQDEIEIPLDKRLSPSENAQSYFKKYTKAKKGLSFIEEQMERTRAELQYLEDLSVGLQLAETIDELREIRDEMAAEGLVRGKAGFPKDAGRGRAGLDGGGRGGTERGRAGRRGAAPGGAGAGAKKLLQAARPEPMRFRSSDGYLIQVGKNTRQNDYLTTRIARPDDIWLHVKEIAGSHVVIRGAGQGDLAQPGTLPDTTLNEAAHLAAYHSKARESSNVPVDYTFVRHVRKPSGAKPGMVIYDHHRTLWVTPDPELIERLRERSDISSNTLPLDPS